MFLKVVDSFCIFVILIVVVLNIQQCETAVVQTRSDDLPSPTSSSQSSTNPSRIRRQYPYNMYGGYGGYGLGGYGMGYGTGYGLGGYGMGYPYTGYGNYGGYGMGYGGYGGYGGYYPGAMVGTGSMWAGGGGLVGNIVSFLIG